jgi:uncharacterized protein (DUF849 family)
MNLLHLFEHQRVYLRLCAPCKARMFDLHVRPKDAVHALCDDCVAKVAQVVRLLTSDNLDAVVDIASSTPLGQYMARNIP